MNNTGEDCDTLQITDSYMKASFHECHLLSTWGWQADKLTSSALIQISLEVNAKAIWNEMASVPHYAIVGIQPSRPPMNVLADLSWSYQYIEKDLSLTNN